MVIINALTQVALPVKQLQQLQSKAGAETRQRGDHDNGRAGNGEDDYSTLLYYISRSFGYRNIDDI